MFQPVVNIIQFLVNFFLRSMTDFAEKERTVSSANKVVLNFETCVISFTQSKKNKTDIKKKLKEKHPKVAELKQSAITDKSEIKTERVIFKNITQDDITSTTENSSGSGRPTQIDMDTWREMICSKSYGTHSKMLADEIATLAKRLVRDTIPHDYISTLLACRLVLLKKKDNGIRPVGIGECLR